MVSEQWLRACKVTAQLLPVDRFLLSNSARAGMRALVHSAACGADRARPVQALAHSVSLQHEFRLRARLQRRMSRTPQTTSTVRDTQPRAPC